MSDSAHIKVVLCWHMHQPQYRNLISGDYFLPWTYLHAIKDYVDMAAHLEAIPEARAVVNFAPILLEQIDDYARQVQGYLTNSTALQDALLAALISPVLPTKQEQRISLIKSCLRANKERMINYFPPYRRLAEIATLLMANPDALSYIQDQFLADLLVWFHLAWLGETVRRQDNRVEELIKKEAGYTLHDRRILLEIIGELLSGVIERYNNLAKRGQVELSMTPYAHPMLPLLLDIKSAREAMPDVQLPALERYPGGEERARWHIIQGIETFQRFFNFKPKGCWPSEGGISTATVRLLYEYGFQWCASGRSVFKNSIKAEHEHSKESHHAKSDRLLYYPYQVPGAETACFFRDDGLSDLIGFTYQNWHADDAVANLMHDLKNIADAEPNKPERVVTIILDGENAWEHYPANGFYFLNALYKKLVENSWVELTTFSGYLAKKPNILKLPGLVAGSWVYGTFSTWIGDTDKNKGWNMLGDAKHTFDRVVASGRLSSERLQFAQRQLALCESSDWFWWFGDYNPEDSVSDFEQLFRQHLTNLYQILGEEPPGYLTQVFTRGHGAPQLGGVMRPGLEAKG